MIEVRFKLEAQHLPEADGHIAVPSEIEINLEGICNTGHPCRKHGHIRDILRRNRGKYRADIICKNDLLGQSPDKLNRSLTRLTHR